MSDRRMFAVLKRLRGSAVPVSALSLACFLLPAASSAQQAGAQTAATIPQNAQPLQAPVQGSGISGVRFSIRMEPPSQAQRSI
jgi:hypothetical protein